MGLLVVSDAWVQASESILDTSFDKEDVHNRACWIREAVQDKVPPARLEPSPPLGLCREIYRVLSLLVSPHDIADTATEKILNSVISGHQVGGFYGDLLVKGTDGASIAVEVDGPRRFYYGIQERIAVCELKHDYLQRQFSNVVHIGFWEWPSTECEQIAFLRARLGW